MAAKQKLSQSRRGMLNHARSRGVVPVRRPLSPESYKVIEKAQKNLVEEVKRDRGEIKTYNVNVLALTLVGLSRFSDLMLTRGPKTSKMIEKVDSLRDPLRMKIGSIGIMGIGQDPKVVFALEELEDEHSVTQEVEEIEKAFTSKCCNKRGDYEFKPEPRGVFEPHLTIAQAREMIVPNFEPESDSLPRYEAAAGIRNKVIIFDPLLPAAN